MDRIIRVLALAGLCGVGISAGNYLSAQTDYNPHHAGQTCSGFECVILAQEGCTCAPTADNSGFCKCRLMDWNSGGCDDNYCNPYGCSATCDETGEDCD